MISRRLFQSGLAVLAVLSLAPAAIAGVPEGQKKHHALSLVGTPKMPADFPNFAWVNPDAPKGGTIRLFEFGGFDSLNPFSDKGDKAEGLGLQYDTLMAVNPDEPATQYGLVAEWVSHPDDYSSVTFSLRQQAKFSDGTPITPEDVVFSMTALKSANPFYQFYYKNVISGEVTGEREVTFTFDVKGNRELPFITGEIAMLSKKFWTGAGANGETRDLAKSTMEAAVGSGPYKIKSFEPNRTIVYERVADYWAKDLAVRRGQWNFDEIRYDYYRERIAGFEAFKSGKVDLWEELVAQAWAQKYDFDTLKKGLIKKEDIPVKRLAPMSGFAFNTRRPQFADPRVRQAFNLAYNFEDANKNFFYGSYVRTNSFFKNSDLEHTGLPTGRELEILKEVENDVPPEVFTTEWKNPVNVSDTDYRKHLSEAAKLLKEAGWTVTSGVLKNSKGEELVAEFLLVQPDFERIVLPYAEMLKRLGVKASVRTIDTATYQRRFTSYDFDIVVAGFAQSESPGNEQRDFWGSAAADKPASRNIIGIKNPALDKLIDNIIFAKDREDLVAACRALDRVLLWNHYVVPTWHYPFERIASWDMFGRPDVKPSQSSAWLQTWWVDPEKKKALGAAGVN